MTNTMDFDERLAELQEQHLRLVADFLETVPLGSFLSKEQFEHACGGVRIDFEDVREYQRRMSCTRAIWTVNKDKRFVGMFVITSQAQRAYDNYQPALGGR